MRCLDNTVTPFLTLVELFDPDPQFEHEFRVYIQYL